VTDETGPFIIESFDSVDDFVSATEDFRTTEPVLTNVIGSIAAGVQAGRVYDTCMLMAVRDELGTVVGCAALTSPWNLVVSPMPRGAGVALGRHMAVAAPDMPGITGVRDVVDAIVEGLELDYEPRVAMVDTVRVIDTFIPPSPDIPGSPRLAVDDDRPLLVEWMVQFAIDASLPLHDVEASVDGRLRPGAFWFWEVDGTPVALAGHAPVVPTPAGNVGRVGPVYTPASQRGHGYAAAITATVVRKLQPECALIMLYADATNPTSNGVYDRLGFRAAGEVIEVELRSAPPDFDNHFH